MLAQMTHPSPQLVRFRDQQMGIEVNVTHRDFGRCRKLRLSETHGYPLLLSDGIGDAFALRRGMLDT